MILPTAPRLSLTQKMIVSFAISGLSLLAALLYSIAGMGTMHRVQKDIAHTDLAAATTIMSLQEIFHAQERLLGRYQILKQQEFHALFQRNRDEFDAGMKHLRQSVPGPSTTQLAAAYEQFAEVADAVFRSADPSPAAVRGRVDQLDAAFEAFRAAQRTSLERKLKESDRRESRTLLISTVLAMGGVASAFLIAVWMTYSFASSINKLQRATHRIAEGDFDHTTGIPPGDEIGSLAQDFSRMAERLKELEQISLDASPLTRLPGNIAIERSLNRRLRERIDFVMCYMDLDNFKSYNDRYGYIKASDLLKETARLIHDVILKINDPEAFVGHIGGDDFVAIVSADRAEAACRLIIEEFDAMIPAYYSDEDRTAGAISGVDRYGVPRSFPLVSISIAALVCHSGEYGSAAEIATAAAEVKDHVKGSSGSNYIIIQGARIYEA